MSNGRLASERRGSRPYEPIRHQKGSNKHNNFKLAEWRMTDLTQFDKSQGLAEE
jgi:hypothetical protein